MPNNKESDNGVTLHSKTEQTIPKNVKYLQQAAAQGHVDSLSKLGDYYLEGKFVWANVTQAVTYYEKAAEKNHANSQLALGKIYLNETYGIKNIETATQWLEKAATAGHADSQYWLGKLLHTETKSYDKARVWLEKAATKDHVGALIMLADIYDEGVGTEKNYTLAEQYLYRAVNKHASLEAYHKLGLIYWEGRGEGKGSISKNFVTAKHNFDQAASKEYAPSQYMLGMTFLEGRGVNKDSATAISWFEKATKNDHIDSSYMLGKVYFEKQNYSIALDHLTKAAVADHAGAQLLLARMYSEEVNWTGKNPTQSQKWFESAANNDNMDAQYILNEKALTTCGSNSIEEKTESELGFFSNFFGSSNTPSKEKAPDCNQTLESLKSAAMANHPNSQYLQGKILLEGKVIEKNETAAKEWFEKAATNEHTGAQYQVGQIAFDAGDYATAIDLFTKSAAKGQEDSQYMLGKMLLEGHGTAVNVASAVNLFTKAATEKNHAPSQHMLGKIYLYGSPPTILKDCEHAIAWLTKSVKQGYTDALYEFGRIYAKGICEEVDEEKAKEYLQRAADQDHGDSMFLLSELISGDEF